MLGLVAGDARLKLFSAQTTNRSKTTKQFSLSISKVSGTVVSVRTNGPGEGKEER